MTKKISVKTHNKNHNEIHIHIGDKKKKATRRKRTARPRAPPPVPFQQSFQPVPIHTNKTAILRYSNTSTKRTCFTSWF